MIKQTVSWNGNYPYAYAFNFRCGRAVTFDDNGKMTVVDENGKKTVDYKSYSTVGNRYNVSFYTAPVYRDVSQLGYFYYDEGLLRVRRVTREDYRTDRYSDERELLIDVNGKEYAVPTGFELVSYSEGVLLLKREGTDGDGARYGYYHKNGYWIAQPIYSYAEPFVEGIGIIGIANGVKGAIDLGGNVVIPFAYTHITNASSGIFACYGEDCGWRVFAKMAK